MKSSFLLKLRDSLAVPGLKGIDLDAPETTALRRELVCNDKTKRFAFEIWYQLLADSVLDSPAGRKVEIGAGGGFLDEFIPGLYRTDVVDLPFLDGVCYAENMPFEDGEISAFLMINVLHHIPDPEMFFKEALRTLKPGGRIAMIEPTVTLLSRFIYKYLHHEPFEPKANTWQLPPAGRLSGGNDALPWIIHYRDQGAFDQKFPNLKTLKRRQMDSLVHLLSGGVTTRALAPLVVLKAINMAERMFPNLMPYLGLFQFVVLEKR